MEPILTKTMEVQEVNQMVLWKTIWRMTKLMMVSMMRKMVLWKTIWRMTKLMRVSMKRMPALTKLSIPLLLIQMVPMVQAQTPAF